MTLNANALAALADLYRVLSDRAPAWMVLRDHEIEQGYWPVPVGSVPWLPAEDWNEHDVVAMHGDEVRIVAIAARKPYSGAFKRLLAGIAAAGLKPVVVMPLEEMTEILTKWGWRGRHVGHDYATFETQWRPPS